MVNKMRDELINLQPARVELDSTPKNRSVNKQQVKAEKKKLSTERKDGSYKFSKSYEDLGKELFGDSDLIAVVLTSNYVLPIIFSHIQITSNNTMNFIYILKT